MDLILIAMFVGSVITVPSILLWVGRRRQERARELLAIMGDHGIPTETGARHETVHHGHGSETKRVTYVRAALSGEWRTFEARVGPPQLSDAGLQPMVYPDPREVVQLVCYTTSTPCRRALDDEGLRASIRGFLESGGTIRGGFVEVAVPGRPDAMGLASMQADVADLVSRLKVTVPS